VTRNNSDIVKVIMEVTVEHLGAVQFEIKARQHMIVSDQPPENGGFDEGMTPPELLLASLGSCAAFYAAIYLRKHKLAQKGTRVRVTAEKRTDPARLDDFRIFVDVPHGIDPKHTEGVEQAVHHCLIHNTLLHPPKITLEIHSPALTS
jgi:putative redox protein